MTGRTSATRSKCGMKLQFRKEKRRMANRKSVHELMENYLKSGDTVEINNGKVDFIVPGAIVKKGAKRNVCSR